MPNAYTVRQSADGGRSEAYDAQLCRLQELIKEKREIEKAMDEKVDELRMVYKKQWRALTKAVQKRLEELS